ncbi:MAG: hypothetical protein ACETVZ_07845 [Phycisphaerae bacterium]
MESRKAQLVVVLIGIVCSSPALALPPMGPPKATLGENQWAVDFKYAYQEMDLELNGKARENDGTGWLLSDLTKYKIEDLTSNIFLGSLGYGICDTWDVFVHVGAADAKDDVAEILGCGRSGNRFEGLDGGYGLVWGFGTRATFDQEDNLTWGGLFQMTWSDPDGGSVGLRGDPQFSGDVELDFWEIQIAAGPTLQFDGFSIYGGPFLHFVKGDMDLKGSTVEDSVTILVESSADIREESILGGYGGLQWDIAENAYWYTECQFTGDAWGLGTGVVCEF